MKILIDAHLSENKLTGIGRYINELVAALRDMIGPDQLSLILNTDLQSQHPLRQLDDTIIQLPAHLHGPSIQQHLVLPKILNKVNPDVYHHPHFDLPFFQNITSVITIHDLKYLNHPEYFSNHRCIKLLYMHSMMCSSLRRAKRIIAVSENTKKDIISIFNVDEKRIRVIHHGRFDYSGGSVQNMNLGELCIKKPFILFVGERRPHKNIPNLILAFQKLRECCKNEMQLVIVGKAYADYHEPEDIVKNNKIEENVIFTGYLPDDQLDFLYKNAYLFILPSFYEGFGFPILEAMHAGVPVIGSSRTSIPEIIGNAGLFCDPESPDQMADQMELLLTNQELRNKLKDAGYQRIKQFTWERTAKETLEVYQEAMALSKIHT